MTTAELRELLRVEASVNSESARLEAVDQILGAMPALLALWEAAEKWATHNATCSREFGAEECDCGQWGIEQALNNLKDIK